MFLVFGLISLVVISLLCYTSCTFYCQLINITHTQTHTHTHTFEHMHTCIPSHELTGKCTYALAMAHTYTLSCTHATMLILTPINPHVHVPGVYWLNYIWIHARALGICWGYLHVYPCTCLLFYFVLLLLYNPLHVSLGVCWWMLNMY